jgi:hypothetical protein
MLDERIGGNKKPDGDSNASKGINTQSKLGKNSDYPGQNSHRWLGKNISIYAVDNYRRRYNPEPYNKRRAGSRSRIEGGKERIAGHF